MSSDPPDQPPRRGPPYVKPKLNLPELGPNPTAQEVWDRMKLRSRLSTKRLGLAGEEKRRWVRDRCIARTILVARRTGDWSKFHQRFPEFGRPVFFDSKDEE